MLATFRRRAGAGQGGFTLVELLVVIVLMGVIGTVFLSTVVNATRVDERTRDRADAQEEVSLALERITKEVRVAAPLVSVSATSVVVDVYPTQPSGSTKRERHTFTLTGAGVLNQQVQTFAPATATVATSSATRVLADGLDAAASSFSAQGRDGVATTVSNKVASVAVTLERDTKSAKPFQAGTTIFLRNYQG